MRALGLCLLGALCLNAWGCANPAQPPSLDPFLGKTTVPPPATGLAAPQSYYPESGAPAAAPQSRLPGKRTGSYTPSDEAAEETESSGGWRANSSSRVRLASGTVEDEGTAEAADHEAEAHESENVTQADYEQEVAEPEQEAPPRTNTLRRRPTITARTTGENEAEVSAATE
ncbi:MAG: hypothetical protein SGJ19_07500 [Planctomycetia bacterium]|nr:hypothetical protein [Planctomycetia bacterium]